ncbi:MAG: SO2930 family diheme c-type cytochrome [Deltaproteobacteria bacterium]
MSRSWIAAVALAAAACSGEATEPPRDAGTARDGGATHDAGFADAGFRDAGTPDAGFEPLDPVDVPLDAPHALLSSYNFFRLVDGRFAYNERVVPYDLSTALFSDFALKDRALYVPTGTAAVYAERDAFEMPVGSAVIKSFSVAPDLRSPNVDRRIIETRVLVRTEEGWETYPYLWNEDGDADYFVRGRVETIEMIDPNGAPRTAQYLVPQKNQCVECHELEDETGNKYLTIVGPKARHLNRTFEYEGASLNQLVHLADLGMLDGLPPIDEVPQAFPLETLRDTSTTALDFETLERAARDYLDINCAHCHNPAGTNGQTSRLYLDVHNTSAFNLGVCKEPGSAGGGAGGLRYDIVPGDADASILVYRTETENVGEMMPLLGRSLKHDLGARVVRAWIDAMPPMSCN